MYHHQPPAQDPPYVPPPKDPPYVTPPSVYPTHSTSKTGGLSFPSNFSGKFGPFKKGSFLYAFSLRGGGIFLKSVFLKIFFRNFFDLLYFDLFLICCVLLLCMIYCVIL